MTEGKLNPHGLTLDELNDAFAPLGVSSAAAAKVFTSIFARGVRTVEELRATPQVPRRVCDFLRDHGEMPALAVVERRVAADGFVKYLFESPLGGQFEAVRIPIFDTKYIVCVSSQVGCALACDFCMTGRAGFQRNLKTWEILDQVTRIREEADRPVRGVVFMGMGEPFLNYSESIRAARILSHSAGFAIDGRGITISTAGIVPAIRRYTLEGHPFRLAFSVTSAIPEKRARLMPIESTYPLDELIDAIREHAAARRERAMIAYVVISGVNTGLEDAVALRDAFAGIPIKLDLIEVTDPEGRYAPPTSEELRAFRDHLQILGAPIARRYSGGKEIGAACGTLAASRSGGRLLASPASRDDAAPAPASPRA
ncbi:MAG: radical SAM protein [bacterium]